MRCYPDLFPDGCFGQNDPLRKVPISEAEYCKARLRSINPRLKQNKKFLFDHQNKHLMREINSGVFCTTNIHTFDAEMTAEKAVDKIQRGDLDKPISTIFSKVRGTQEYFKIPKWNSETMIRNYGPATWFMTFSPTEWLWPDFKEFLRKVNPNIDKSKCLAELSSIDPVGTAAYINARFDTFLKFLHGPENPKGKIKHYFLRREYQNRCVTHFPCLFWIESAPIIGENTENEISDFIQRYVTCSLPKKNEELFELMDTVQRHYCNHYCTKTFYGCSNSCRTKYCRFKFPRNEKSYFVLNDVAAAIAARKTPKNLRLYELPRKTDEIYINDYNPACLKVTRCNIDLQFISEKSCKVTEYVNKYCTKAETAQLQDPFSKSAVYEFCVMVSGL